MPNLPFSVLIHCHCICDDQLAIYRSVKAQRGIPEHRDQIKVSGARTFFFFFFFNWRDSAPNHSITLFG